MSTPTIRRPGEVDVVQLAFTACAAVRGDDHTWANIEKVQSHKSPLLKQLYDTGVATLGYPENRLARRLVDFVYFYRSDDSRFMNTQQIRLSPLRCLNGAIFFTVVNAMLAEQPDAAEAVIRMADDYGKITAVMVRQYLDEAAVELLLDCRKALSPADEVLEARDRCIIRLLPLGFCMDCASEVMTAGLDYIERNDD